MWAAAAYTLGLLVARGMPAGAGGLLSAACLAAALACYRRRGMPFRQHAALAMAFGALALFNGALHVAYPPSRALAQYATAHDNETVSVEGRVLQAPVHLAGEEYVSFPMELLRSVPQGESAPPLGHVLVRWSRPSGRLSTGQTIQVQGRLHFALDFVNPGSRSWEDDLRGAGIEAQIRCSGDQLSPGAESRRSAGYWTSRFRQWQADRFQECIPQPAQGYAIAVWLGARNAIPYTEQNQFKYSGTTHLLSVSGVHVAIVFLSLDMLLTPLMRNRKRRILAGMTLVWLFALVAGAQIPSIRSAAMLTLYLLADFLDREPDAPTAISMAALFFLVINPANVNDTSFILSFGSVASILLFAAPLGQRLTWLPVWTRSTAAGSIGVQLLPFPFLAHSFHLVAWTATLANLAAIPIVTVMLWLCLAVAICSIILPPAALIFGSALLLPTWLLQGIVFGIASQRWTWITVVSPTWLAAAAYLLAVAVLLAILHQSAWWRKGAAAVCALLLFSILTWNWRYLDNALFVLDVGHGDAMLLTSRSGKTVLIDTADRSEYINMADRAVVPFLLSRGITSLDHLIVTHPDRDHIGGAPSLLETVAVKELLLSSYVSDSGLETELLEAAAAYEIPTRRVGPGDAIDLGNIRLEVRHPPPDLAALNSDNERSVVCLLHWGGKRILLTGDIEKAAESLVAPGLEPVDLLMAPHHGSRTSSSPALVDAARPIAAFCSTRYRRTSAAVHPSVAARYRERGIPLWRTDLHGGLHIGMRDQQFYIDAARVSRGYSLPPD